MAAKSVVELWLLGGPSSLETFDPKPEASVDYNNGLKAIDTNVPGVRIHEWWPNLAKCADLYSIIRTMTHPHPGHETAAYLMQTGRNPGGGDVYPAIGAVISMMKAKDYHGDLPPYVILTSSKGRFSEVGFLGEQCAPLVTGGDPRQAKFIVDGIVPPGALKEEDIERRFELLKLVDRFGSAEERRDFEAAGEKARHIINGDAAKTFDLSQESKETRERYGRSWIGQSLLAARRLVEYGVPYININMSGWDSHKRHFESVKQRTSETDVAVAAFLSDLAERKLLDSTAFWMSGEFGRTTKIDRNPPWNGGRNHYSKCFCALVAGGGFKGGCVVGESDETATKVVKRPVTPVDFLGSIYEVCGINPDGDMPNPVGKKVPILPPPSKEGRLKELYKFALGAALALSALFLPGSASADPYVGYIYPAGIRAGTTNRVIVGGQALYNAHSAFVTGEGVRVINVEKVPNFAPPLGNQRGYLIKWLEGIAKGNREAPPIPEGTRVDEWRSNVWWRALGELDDLKLAIVERDLYTKRNTLQMSPSLRQMLILTVVADADAKPGFREFRMVAPVGMSPPRPFEVTSAQRTAEPRFAAPFRSRPKTPCITEFPAVLDGRIMPGETDSWKLCLRAGAKVVLRTVGRELQPYIGDAVPGFFNPSVRLLSPAGDEVAFADDYFYHPDPQLVFVPPVTGEYTLEIHDVLYRGREDFVYSIAVEEYGELVPVDKTPLWPLAGHEIPDRAKVAEFRGTIGKPGKMDEYEVEIPSEGEYVVDLLARRTGSPLDARVTVVDDDGNVVAVFSDCTNEVFRGSIIQAECDPVGRVRLKADDYTFRVEDESGKGGAEYGYVLRVHRPAPRFEVWTDLSGFTLRPGNARRTMVQVIRHDGFDGAVRLMGNDCVRFSPEFIPAGTNAMKVSVCSTAKVPVETRTFELFASATIGGETTVERICPADEYNQAFAWNHLLPAKSFAFKGIGKAAKKGKKRK